MCLRSTVKFLIRFTLLTQWSKVLIAFCVTSFATFIAIVSGYFYGCIRDGQKDGLLNVLDYRMIKYTSRRNNTNNGSHQLPWQDALERFVLSLSDQQLVTGIAIFSIGYIRHCSLSSYHFFVIVELAWFSSTTHLSTLSVLQHHLNRYPALKYTRIIGMVILYVMLVVGLRVVYVSRLFQVSLQCRLENLSLAGNGVLNKIVAILLFAFLTVSYVLKLFRLLPAKLQMSNRARDLDGRRIHCEKKIEFLHAFDFPKLVEGTLKLFVISHYVFLVFMDSFLWEICWMFFGNIWGIRQVFWARQFVRSSIILVPKDAENELSFGQLLALFLLVLPFLSAFEALEGK